MALIRAQGAVAETTATTSVAAPTVEHQTNDLLIVFPCHDNSTGGTWNTPTGWTLVNNTQSDAMSSAWLWKIAVSASETFPTMSTSATEEQGCYAISIRDVDTADPINSSRVDTFSSGNTHTSTGLVTDEDKCLMLYLQAGDSARFPNIQPGFMALPEVYTGGAFQQRVAWTWQESVGTAETITFHLGTSDSGHIHTIAINSSNSSPITPAYCDIGSPPTTVIHPLRGIAYTNGDWGGGNVDPSTDLAAGIGPDSTTFNYDSLGTQVAGGVGGLHPSMITDTPSSSSALEIWGAVWDLSIASIDLTDKIACLHIGMQSPQYFGAIDTVTNGGYIVGFRSDSTGTVGYRMWNVGASDASPSPLDQHAVVFDVGDTTRKYHDAGTFDITQVDGIFLACNKGGGVDVRVTYTECHILNTVVLLGGSAGTAAPLQGFVDSLKASNVKTISNQGGSSSKQYYTLQGVQIGNGTDTVNFADPNASLQTAAPATGKNLQFNVDDDQTPLTIYASASCTIDLSNMVFTGNGETPFTIHASSSSSATYLSTATTVIGRDVTLQDVFTAGGGVTWSGCKEITHNSADRSGGDIISECTDAQAITLTGATEAALQALIDNWANCNFKTNAVAIRIEFTGTGAVSLTFDAILFSGNTADIHYNSTASSALTAVMSNGSNATTSAISGSATSVTISNDVTHTIEVDVTGAEITLVETGTTTEDYHVETGSTTQGFTFTAPLGHNCDLYVFKPGYKPFRRLNFDLGSADSTTSVTLDVEPAYA